MSLFKILRGSEANLPTTKTDGWAYFCADTGSFWIDHLDSNNTLVRSKISANFADKLRYIKNGETVELDPSEIATHTELASKLSAQNPSAAGALTISNNWENGVASFYKSNDPTNDYGTVIRDQDADANALSVVISAKNKSVSITDGESYYDVLTTEDMATLQTQLDNKVDKVAGKGLSTNDLTNALKGNYDTAYTHSQATHAPAGAQANVIESVKVNGTALTVTNKSVNVTVPTGALASKSKVSESDLDSTLATKLNGMTDAEELEAAISAEAQRVDTALSGKANTSHSHNDVYYTETEVDTKLDNKVDKVNGKGLSTNDYTTTEKTKLAGIEAGANKYVLPSATDSVVGGMKLYTSTGSNTAGTMTQKAITDALAGKSGTGHNHDSVYSKLGHTHTAADVGATTETYVDSQIAVAKSYTDTKVAELVDSAPDTLNTLNELAAALGDDPNFATTTATELGKKATKTELTTHASSNIHITSTERTNWNAAKTHADSAHAPSNAERNIIVGIQKNGTDVTVNSTTRKVNITVPTKTSELTNNSDFATNASVTSVKEELQADIDGKAASSHNHTASNITSGTLSSDRLPTVPVAKGGTGATTAAGALTNLGLTATASELNVLDGITATTAELNKLDGVTATTAELNYVDGVTSNIQTQLNGKASTTHAHDMKELEGFFIELNNKGTKGTGHGGYLDFHYDGSGADYTSRIIESANGTLSVNGVKCASSGVTCSAVDITNGAQKNKASGFVKLNNGVILQWGTVANVANGTSTWVNFPLTFPNSVGGTAMLTGNYGNSFGYELHANDISASGFTIVKKGGSSTSGTDTVSWLVVGW